jgi:glycosyltransferase involved in cell wall biosynthesis
VVPVDDVAGIASAIERLYRNEDLRRSYGRAARNRIGTQFRIADTISKTAQLYRELVNP